MQLRRLLPLLLLFGCTLNAQRAHVISAELLGAGLFYSLNYDVRFQDRADGIGGRTGIAVYDGATLIPVQANYLFGANKHKFELGLGGTIQFQGSSSSTPFQLVPSATLMYRYQPDAKRFVFRAGLSPTFVPTDTDDTFSGLNRIFWFWPGISFGYRL